MLKNKGKAKAKQFARWVGDQPAKQVRKKVEQHRKRGICVRQGCGRKVHRVSRHSASENHCGRPECAEWAAYLDLLELPEEEFDALMALPDEEFAKRVS